MAIQNRRGLKKDFDPTKMLPGEWAVTIDPETENQMVYMCFAPGVVKRMGTYEDFKDQIDEATGEIKEEYLAAVESASSEAITKIEEGVASVETSAAEIAADREQIQTNKTDIANLEKLAITPTATGSQIVARDSAEWPIQALTLYGRTEQAKTKGAQLIDFSRATYQRCTLVDAKTGTIQSNINNHYFCTIYVDYLADYFMANLGKAISLRADNNPNYISIIIYGERTSGGTTQEISNQGSRVSITIAEDFTSISQVELRVNRKPTDVFTDTSTLISGLMLYEGSEEKAFEPYTGGKPAPSPDYPQPIVSAGERLSTGVQLFDVSKAIIHEAPVGLAISLDKDVFTIKGTAEKASGMYSFNFVNTNDTNLAGKGYIIQAFDATGTTIKSIYGLRTETETAIAIGFDATQSQDIDVSFRVMVSKERATTYEPYTGGVPAAYPVGIDVAVEGKNLFDISIRDLISSGYDVANATLISQTETGVVVQGNVGSSSGGDAGYSNGWYRPGNNQQSKNKLYLKKGTTVTVSADYTVLEFRYDNRTANQNRIGVHLYTYAGKQNYVGTNINIDTANKKYRVTNTFTITIEDGLAYYPVFSLNSNKVQIDNIQIEIGSSATAYEPYRGRQTVTLASNGLPGIPVTSGGNYTDESSQQWVCDTIENRNGQAVYVQRVWSKTFTGSADELWNIYGAGGAYPGFYAVCLPENMSRRRGFCNLLNIHEEVMAGVEGAWIGVNNNTMYVHNSSFYDDSLDDKGLANWKAYLAAHPMTVMTYLTTPVETPLTDAEAAQLAALHTYKPTTTITNDAGVEMEVEYVADTKAYIDNKFAELQAAQATTNAQLI